MELLLSASLVAAFVAGLAALLAPCCITVLLPGYFASVFREKYKVFLMTFVFFLGILTVFLPIGLGAGFLGQFFSRYHNQIFGVGAVFLIILGVALLSGKHFSLPFQTSPSLKKHNAGSVFVLGIFSGIATTCCAPVLAGVLALSALPGSVFWGGIYALSYVLGMVAPLFFLSLFLDKVNLINKLNRRVAERISGFTFLAMGGLIIYLALTNRLFTHSSYQTDINIFLTKFLNSINNYIKFVPEYVWALLLVVAVGVILRLTINKLKEEKL